jgi:hypothetical protein
LQIAIYKNGQIIAIMQIIKIPLYKHFLQFMKAAKLLQFCQLQYFLTAKLLQFCESQSIIKTAKIAKSSNPEFTNYKLSEFRSGFFPAFCNLQHMPAICTLHQNCLSAAKLAYSRRRRQRP